MSVFDKIAILWIDDMPESGHPERGLGVYDRFFEVVCKDDAGRNDSLKSIEGFNQLLKDYLSPNAKESVFPVELVAVDYDLATYNPSGQRAGQFDVVDASDADEGESIDDSSQSGGPAAAAELVDFDGFLIGSIYAAHFRLHPVGMVATTYQSKRMGTTVRQLENTLMMCYDVDIDFAGKKRTWKNILEAGVRRLRSRIERLYQSHKIVVSTRDLLALTENPNHELLTIQSRFGTRRLPVQGLFIDVLESKRGAAIRSWANKLQNFVISKEDFKAAKKLAGAVWDSYNNTQLVEQRGQLSALLAPLRGWVSTVSELESSLKDVNEQLYKTVRDSIKRLGPMIEQIKEYRHSEGGANEVGVAEKLLEIKGQVSEMFRSEYAQSTSESPADKIACMVHRELVVLLEADKVRKLQELCGTFAVSSSGHGACGADECCTLYTDEYSGLVRRWAAVLITMRLVRRVLKAKKEFDCRVHELTGQKSIPNIPEIGANDVFLAYYPIPAKPLVFSWHGGASLNNSHTWVGNLLDLSDESLPSQPQGGGRGNLALRVSDVLAGEDWNPKQDTFGLKSVERQFLKGLVMADEEVSIEDWKRHFQAKQILYGNENEEVRA